jgi:hypothetical protein
MRHATFAYIVALVLLSTGCAQQRMYYWGEYSNTLYQCKKHPSDQSGLAHQQALENIIEESEKSNLRIPPGVCAELGYIYFRQNKKDLAIKNFQMERQLYPESGLLMDRLENAVKIADKPKSSDSSTPDKPSAQADK